MEGECFIHKFTRAERGKRHRHTDMGAGTHRSIRRPQPRHFVTVGLISTYFLNYSHAGCLIFGSWGSHQALIIAGVVGYRRGT